MGVAIFYAFNQIKVNYFKKCCSRTKIKGLCGFLRFYFRDKSGIIDIDRFYADKYNEMNNART